MIHQEAVTKFHGDRVILNQPVKLGCAGTGGAGGADGG
jgi:hypothetical protein